ncbi:GTP-binding protein [Cellvibrio sp. NN19]|uniref:CobW family GTP-binding protein n=1 Tax=Cellvibrio chitinivorans TaxID=3102792 RepID=UPI002B40CA10|nr:GTP-binding protein [Cellvibrio sp. NN19]
MTPVVAASAQDKKRIPTNIITGFLGVGKTTAITHLLKTKPEHEVWSVLVNEFGEIGIDGALLKGTNAHVREVPGGCICCVAGLPMKIALNMLIAKTNPDRIIIEPTGLGHPEEIINTLTGEYYDTVLDLRATITLVDPRKLADERYTENATFQDQIAVADVLVANKLDQCSSEDRILFDQLVSRFEPPKAATYAVELGQLELEWLDVPRSRHQLEHPQHHAAQRNRLSPQRELYNNAIQLPEGQDFLRRENQGQGMYSCGWLFRPELRFGFNQLFGWMTGLPVLRSKAVMNTDQGVYMFNAENGVLSVKPLMMGENPELLDSRIELIDDKVLMLAELEAELFACRLDASV